MQVNGVNNNIRIYSVNRLHVKNEINKTFNKDKIEISSLGKALNEYSINYNEVDREKKVAEIKEKIESGTYKVNSKELTKKILKYMGDKEYEN
ncbi:flagellar biosynthesis anti-sigma factor FlgM [Clostridium thermobutyricum]